MREAQAVLQLGKLELWNTCELPSLAMAPEPDMGTLSSDNSLGLEERYNSSCDETFQSLMRHALKNQQRKIGLRQGIIIRANACATQKLPEQLCGIVSLLEHPSEYLRVASESAVQKALEEFRQVKAAQVSEIETELLNASALYAYLGSQFDFEPGPRIDFDKLLKLFNSLGPLPKATLWVRQWIFHAQKTYVETFETLRSVTYPLVDVCLHQHTLQSDLARLAEQLLSASEETEEREIEKERLMREIAKAQAEHDWWRAQFDELVNSAKSIRARYQLTKEHFVSAVLPYLMCIEDNCYTVELAEEWFQTLIEGGVFQALIKQVDTMGNAQANIDSATDQSLPNANPSGQAQATTSLQGQTSKMPASSSGPTPAPAQVAPPDAWGSYMPSGSPSIHVQKASKVSNSRVLGKRTLPPGTLPLQGAVHRLAPNQNLLNSRPGRTAANATQFYLSLPQAQMAPQEDATRHEGLQQNEKGPQTGPPPHGSILPQAQTHTEVEASNAPSNTLSAQPSAQDTNASPSQAASRLVQVPQARMSVVGNSAINLQTNESPALASQTLASQASVSQALISQASISQPSASQPSTPTAVRKAPQAQMVTPVGSITTDSPVQRDIILPITPSSQTDITSSKLNVVPSSSPVVRHQAIVQPQSNPRHRTQVLARSAPDATPQQIPRRFPLSQHRVPTDQGIASVIYPEPHYLHNNFRFHNGIETPMIHGPPPQMPQQNFQPGFQYNHQVTMSQFDDMIFPHSFPMTPSNSGSSMPSQHNQVWPGAQSMQHSLTNGPHITPAWNYVHTPQMNAGTPVMHQAYPLTPPEMMMPGQNMLQSPFLGPQPQMHMDGQIVPQYTQPDVRYMPAQAQAMAFPPQQPLHDFVPYDNPAAPPMGFPPHPTPTQSVYAQSFGQQVNHFNFQPSAATQSMLYPYAAYMASQSSQEYQGSPSKRRRLKR